VLDVPTGLEIDHVGEDVPHVADVRDGRRGEEPRCPDSVVVPALETQPAERAGGRGVEVRVEQRLARPARRGERASRLEQRPRCRDLALF